VLNKIGMSLLVLLSAVVACGESSPAPKSGAEEVAGTGGGTSSGGTQDTMGSSGSMVTTGIGGDTTGTGTGSGGGGSGQAGSQGEETPEGGAAGTAVSTFDGGTNFVPADYKGKPFTGMMPPYTLQIPGTIHMADYDLGGAGVAYCHGNMANCAGGIKMTDWDCGPGKGGDHRKDPNCPPYRPDADNAGLCHMNTGEPDNTTTGQPYSPYYPYLCYTATGEWTKYTVQVTQAGTYSIGGAMAVPGGVTVELDFGNGVTTGSMALPQSPTAMCKCPETYHSWETVTNVGMVTFASAGTYVMTMKILSQQYNPETFVFTKM
jgi:hypothetical protein